MHFKRTSLRENNMWKRDPLKCIKEGAGGAIIGGALGSLLGPAGTAAGAYLGHALQKAWQRTTSSGEPSTAEKLAHAAMGSKAKKSQPGFLHSLVRGRLGLPDTKSGTIGHKLGSMWADRAALKSKQTEKPAEAPKAPEPQTTPKEVPSPPVTPSYTGGASPGTLGQTVTQSSSKLKAMKAGAPKAPPPAPLPSTQAPKATNVTMTKKTPFNRQAIGSQVSARLGTKKAP